MTRSKFRKSGQQRRRREKQHLSTLFEITSTVHPLECLKNMGYLQDSSDCQTWYPPDDQVISGNNKSLLSTHSTKERCIYGPIGTIRTADNQWISIVKY